MSRVPLFPLRVSFKGLYRGLGVRDQGPTVDDRNPALPMIRNIPSFPEFQAYKVMLRICIISCE